LTSKFLFYGGKGGVGKTTLAAARALTEAANGHRVVVVSTDPAHSLGDVLDARLTSAPRTIRRRLQALELDGPGAFRRWLRRHRPALRDILEEGTWLDRGDVEALLDLPIPGIDELVGLLEIARLAETTRADRIVVDTAPTGHALRMLAAPQTVGAVAGALDALYETHRIVRDQLARVGGPEASDRLIALLAAQAREIAEMLRDPSRTAMHWVTLPEDLSVEETMDAVGALEEAGIRVGEIVINRVLPDGAWCPLCGPRRFQEQRAIVRIRRGPGRNHVVSSMAAEVREPRGARALMSMSTSPGSTDRPRVGRLETSALPAQHTIRDETINALNGGNLLFFVGKGGVGKTTVSAATAVRVAHEQPRKRVLLISTDPAHSLADVFDAPVGDVPHRITRAPQNLALREIDTRRALQLHRTAIESALDEIASTLGAGPASDARASAADMFDLAPPGVDELLGMLSILDARDHYDLIVVDAAPTGHALRLLELPTMMRQWSQVFLRVLLKYRAVARPGGLAAELIDFSRSVRELIAWLRDANRTHFIVVTRASAMPFSETDRLIDRLRRMKLAVPAIVVNALTANPGRCRWCRAVATEERRWVGRLRRASRSHRHRCAIIQTPLSAPPPRGARRLRQWGAEWVQTNDG
jgi:arsenite/tail-anchored protein-transporting ATPase